MLTAEQMRAARAALRMEQATLAEKAGLSVETIKRLERLDGELGAQVETIDRIISVFRDRGIVLLDAGEGLEAGGPGIRLIRDRSAALRDEIAKAVTDVAKAIVEGEYRQDKAFFSKPLDEIASILDQRMKNSFKNLIVRVLSPVYEGRPPR